MAARRHRRTTSIRLPLQGSAAARVGMGVAVSLAVGLLAAAIVALATAGGVARADSSAGTVNVLPGDIRLLGQAGVTLQVLDADDFRAAVFDEVNERREAVGEDPLTEAATLRTAAQAHADYLALNGGQWGVGAFDAHEELPELPGYYALDVGDRALRAGYPHDRVFEDVLRLRTPGAIVPGSPWDAEELVAGWIDAPLHRRAVLDRSLMHAGVGYAADGIYHAYVLATGQDHFAPSKPSSVQPYPVNGQTGVPTTWDGNENPQPFPGLIYPSGYPITVFPVWGGSAFVDVRLDLERADDGAPVEVVKSTVRNVAFAPVEPLEPGTTYTATVAYTLKNAYTGALQSGGLIWDFTTAGAAPPTSTTTTSPPTTTTGSTSTTVPVTTTTLPPTTTTLPPAAFADVPGTHPYRQAIGAMAARGVIAGYANAGAASTFRPDDPVLRQQFAKMIVTAVGLPVTEGGVTCPFPDVEKPATSLYPDDYVAVAAAEGIVRGYTGGTFAPYQPMSRAQLITMVVRGADTQLPGRLRPPQAGFVGTLPAGDPTHGAGIRLAEANGLLEGVALSGWDVWARATRGEVAQILWNLVG